MKPSCKLRGQKWICCHCCPWTQRPFKCSPSLSEWPVCKCDALMCAEPVNLQMSVISEVISHPVTRGPINVGILMMSYLVSGCNLQLSGEHFDPTYRSEVNPIYFHQRCQSRSGRSPSQRNVGSTALCSVPETVERERILKAKCPMVSVGRWLQGINKSLFSSLMFLQWVPRDRWRHTSHSK